MFKTVKELEGKSKKSLTVIKDSNGAKHFQLEKVLDLWKEHFENHLNTEFPHDEDALNSLANESNEIEFLNELISIEEVNSAVKKMKKRKAPGSDEITTEVIKSGGAKMIEMLHKIFNLIWTSEKTPADFSRMIVSPIHKKGDRLKRDNYRAISLLSIPGKVFLHILMNRMKDKVERKLKESQYGFRPGRGTVDAIFIIRQIIEKAREKKIPLNFHFIDFKAAFDTIWRKALWQMLNKIGVNPKITRIVQYMYNNTQCAVIIDNNLTEWFTVEVGVRQGCILSPMFFNIFLEFVMDEISSLRELHLNENLSANIRYADDTTFISVIFDKLKIATQELETACRKWGLKINGTKCKIISSELDEEIDIDDEAIEKVENFVFLGSVVPNSTDDIVRRIALASTAFGRLKNTVWNRRDLSNKIKVRLYNALIVPIAIYASETWTLKAEDERKLTVFENDCLRNMVGRNRIDRCKMKDIRRQLGVTHLITDVVTRRRLTWFGHVIRRGDASYVYRTYKEEFPGKRPQGRPPKRWVDDIRLQTKIPLLTLERKALNRNKWKAYVDKECAKIPGGLCI